MKFKQLKQMQKQELNQTTAELKRELVKLYAQVATGTPPKNSGQIRNSKRTIARIKTIFAGGKQTNE
jgi:ribosomal protein L29